MILQAGDPVADALVAAVRGGDVEALGRLLASDTERANVLIRGEGINGGFADRSLLHQATDWPGHNPRVGETIAALIEAGADPNVRLGAPNCETPLHWAASSDDVVALDALLDAGADIDADGAVIADGTALMDAVAFAQWNTARRLVERGATVTFWQAAALGHVDRLRAEVSAQDQDAVDEALWAAAHGGQLATARLLHGAGGDLDRIARWEPMTPLDAARRSCADDVEAWLVSLGARTAADLHPS